jgi:hypothetical protein
MNTDKKSNKADSAPTGYGLRREAKRHAALEALSVVESGVAATLCHRTPNFQ